MIYNAALQHKAVSVLCSRVKSSRLPEKAFLPIAGKPTIELCVERAIKIGIPLILAVPEEDGKRYSYLLDIYPSINLYVGESDSPLHRTAQAIKNFPDAKHIIRITHDDPLIDPQSAYEALNNAYFKGIGYSISNGIVDGGGVEIVSRENFEWAAENYKKPCEFISYVVRGPNVPNQNREDHIPRESIRRKYRLTLDYPEDWWLLDSILSIIGTNATLDDVCGFLDKNPVFSGVNKLPIISFYTSVYNGKDFISGTMASVMNSTSSDWEYIIIDDGSNDTTTYEITRFLAMFGTSHGKIKFIKNAENKGLAFRSNEAIALCKGKYVMRVDADDILLPGTIDEMIKISDKEKSDIVYSYFSEIDVSGNTTGMHENSDRHAGCALMRRSFIDEAKFKEDLRLGDSKDLWDRAKKWAKISEYKKVGWHYRRHSGSLTYRG